MLEHRHVIGTLILISGAWILVPGINLMNVVIYCSSKPSCYLTNSPLALLGSIIWIAFGTLGIISGIFAYQESLKGYYIATISGTSGLTWGIILLSMNFMYYLPLDPLSLSTLLEQIFMTMSFPLLLLVAGILGLKLNKS